MRSYELDKFTQLDVTIEMDFSQIVLTRQYYSVLDYLSDIGGFKSSFITVIIWFMTMSNHNMIDNFMVERLYKIKSISSSAGSSSATSENLQAGKLDSIKRCWNAAIPWALCKVCCKPSRT